MENYTTYKDGHRNVAEHVMHMKTEHVGGGMITDFIYLNDGQIVGIGPEVIALYKNQKTLNESNHSKEMNR